MSLKNIRMGAKQMIKKPSDMKVIMYDDKNLEYFVGNYGCFDMKTDVIEVNGISDLHSQFIPGCDLNCSFSMNNTKKHDTIKLDETLMRRIAKYNKEQVCKNLDIEIAEKRKQIKELDDILTDRVGRVEKLKAFIKDIYDIDLHEEYDDDDYYD